MPTEVGDKLAVIMEVICISEMYGCLQITECYNPGDCTLTVLTFITEINFSFGDYGHNVMTDRQILQKYLYVLELNCNWSPIHCITTA
jgi:hypothetical protein